MQRRNPKEPKRRKRKMMKTQISRHQMQVMEEKLTDMTGSKPYRKLP